MTTTGTITAISVKEITTMTMMTTVKPTEVGEVEVEVEVEVKVEVAVGNFRCKRVNS